MPDNQNFKMIHLNWICIEFFFQNNLYLRENCWPELDPKLTYISICSIELKLLKPKLKCWFSGPYSHFSENRVNKCMLKNNCKIQNPNYY